MRTLRAGQLFRIVLQPEGGAFYVLISIAGQRYRGYAAGAELSTIAHYILAQIGEHVSKWVASPQPSADLTEIPELARTDPDGTKVQVFQTQFGKRFAKVVEPNGFIVWLQEVQTP